MQIEDGKKLETQKNMGSFALCPSHSSVHFPLILQLNFHWVSQLELGITSLKALYIAVRSMCKYDI